MQSEYFSHRTPFASVDQYLVVTEVDAHNGNQQALRLAKRNRLGKYILEHGYLITAYDLAMASKNFAVKYASLSTADGTEGALRDARVTEEDGIYTVWFKTKAERDGEIVPAIGHATFTNPASLDLTILPPIIRGAQ